VRLRGFCAQQTTLLIPTREEGAAAPTRAPHGTVILDHRDGAGDHLFAMVHQGIRTTWWIPHAAMKEGGGPHSPTSHSRFKLERIWSTYSNINHRSFIIPLSAFWLRSSLGSICFYQHLIWVRCFALSQQTSTSFPINQQEQHSATSSSTLSPMLNPMRPPYHPQIAHA
jgi:hypothetical protein